MSAPAMSTQEATPQRRVPVRPVSLASTARSEWIKFATLRSTWLVLGLATLGTIVVGAAAGWDTNNSWFHRPPDEVGHFSAIDTSLTGVVLAQLAIAVLAVLMVGGEYATGMIRSTIGATPRRSLILWAKLGVFGFVVSVTMLATTFLSFVLGQVFLQSHGIGLGAPHVAQSVVGATFYLLVVSILSIAISFIARSVAGALGAVVALLLVLPGIGSILPVSWQTHVIPYLPSNAGLAVYGVQNDPSASLGPLTAVITLVLWCVVAIAAALYVLRTRDA